MNTLQQRISEVMAASDLSQAEISRICDVKPATVSLWVIGPTQTINPHAAARLEAHTGYSAIWLSTGEGSKKSALAEVSTSKKTKGYPMLSWTQAAQWPQIRETIKDTEHRQCHKDLGPNGYVLRVADLSMTAAPDAEFSFPRGTLLYINPDIEALASRFIIVRRAGQSEAVFRRLAMLDGELWLEAINHDWPNHWIKLHPGDTFCGTVVFSGRDDLP